MEDTENKLVCPNCHSDNIQSYSVAWQEGVQGISTTTAGVGYANGFGFGASKTSGVAVSALAESVAPPVQKTPNKWIAGFLVIWVIIDILGLIVPLSQGSISDLLFGLVKLAIPGGILYYLIRRCRVWNSTEYPKLVDQWQRSWICKKCGSHFTL